MAWMETCGAIIRWPVPIQSSMPRCGSCTQAQQNRDHPVLSASCNQELGDFLDTEAFPRCSAILASFGSKLVCVRLLSLQS